MRRLSIKENWHSLLHRAFRRGQTLNQILEKYCEVHLVWCKVLGIPKTRFGFKPIKDDRDQTICNPVGQAELLNRASIDLNVIVGYASVTI